MKILRTASFIGMSRSAASGGNAKGRGLAVVEVVMIWNGAPCGFDRDGKPISYNAQDDGSGNAPSLCLGAVGTGKTVNVCNEPLDEPGERSYVLTDFKG